jgi:DNA-binding IclR family transcriptional regulator
MNETQELASRQVLAKAAALLECLRGEPELSAARLATLVGEPRSTVYRLLATLQRLELVESGAERGTYRLGLQLFRLGSAVMSRFDERQAALPVLERIHDETGETVFLCIRRGWEAICIERIDGRRVQSLLLKLGGSLPLHAGAGPAVLIAFEPETIWADYARSATFQPMTDKSIASRAELIQALRRIRKRGIAISDEDVALGFAAIGAPVFDHRGCVCAAISISGVRPVILGLDRQLFEALVVDGAREISNALGYDGREIQAG